MSLFRPALGVLGFVLVLLSGLMLLPLTMVFVDGIDNYHSFVFSFSITAVVGLTLILFFRGSLRSPNARNMFLITGLAWIGVSLFAGLPLLLSNQSISVTDAAFEAVSGITTTGSTVLKGLDHYPRDLLLWRSIMQWIGGIGVIGMAIAILPFLRVGGMRLFQTESSDWSEKTVARSSSQFRYIFLVYIVASLACAAYYGFFGMGWFDAINHAMTTISTGGYSTSDQSLGHFQNSWIQWGSVFFMLVGGLPFTLYIRLLITRETNPFRDDQVLAFLTIVVFAGLVLTTYLMMTSAMPFQAALLRAFVNSTSVITTTGYATEDYANWGTGAVAFFFFLTVVGGCSGSTSGGIKVFRLQLLWLFFKEQLIRSVHPRAVVALKYNHRPVSPDVVSSFIAFGAMAVVTFMVLTVGLGLAGLDVVTAASGTLTAMMNVGPGLGGTIGPAGNFATLPNPAKWLLCLGMLLGRLEYLTLVVLIMPGFWRD